MPKPNTNITDYLTFQREGSGGTLDILQPVVYSNSHIFGKFNYQKEFEDLTRLSIKIGRHLVFDSYLVILLEDLRAYCKLCNIKLLVVSENDEFDAYWEFLSAKTLRPLKKEKANLLIDFFEDLGRKGKFIFSDLMKFVEFIGEVVRHIVLLPACFRHVR